MNAQMQKDYANTVQLYASAKQAEAQAGYLLAQTTGQNYQNQAMLNQLNAKPPAAAPAPPRPNVSAPAPSAPRGSTASTNDWGGVGSFMQNLTGGIGNVFSTVNKAITGF
jgi:hypothetical protein